MLIFLSIQDVVRAMTWRLRLVSVSLPTGLGSTSQS
jgi:hypothetical protein